MNPFLISGYKSPEFFCDRDVETKKIISAIRNLRNITLVSERRMGKTGLIKHVEKQVENDTVFIYVDLYPSLNLNEFVQMLSNEIVKALEPFSEKVIKKITGFFGALKPKFSFDPETGTPNMEFSISGKAESEKSVSMLFEYIRASEKKVTIAFDEFQQILRYPEKNVEALLRTEIQKNVESCFIFSGSQTHLLISMFNEYSRPFYQSTEIIELGKIDKTEYSRFISSHFENSGKQLDEPAALLIYELNRGITYNVQFLSNRLFSLDENWITSEMAIQLLNEIIKENEIVYYNYRELVTDLQFRILKAVAKEETVEKPFSNSFIKKYNLGSTSSVKSGIDTLINKSLLISKNGFRITDWYFSLWLSKQL